MRTQLYEKPPEFPDGFFRARVPLPGNSSRSSNDVVEHPLPERPVEQARHAIPPSEPPLRDEASFYAPVEPPSAQHHLRKEVILGQAGTGPQGLLTGAARTGDNFPRTSTFRTRAFCPRKGAHFVKKHPFALPFGGLFSARAHSTPTLSRLLRIVIILGGNVRIGRSRGRCSPTGRHCHGSRGRGRTRSSHRAYKTTSRR